MTEKMSRRSAPVADLPPTGDPIAEAERLRTATVVPSDAISYAAPDPVSDAALNIASESASDAASDTASDAASDAASDTASDAASNAAPHSATSAPGTSATVAMDVAPRMSTADFRVLLERDHPFAAGLGIDIVDIGYGTAHAVLPAQPAHRRLGDIVAGPMLMGLADVALYAAVVGATGQAHAVTATLTINFLQKCPARDVHAHARLLKVGRSTMGEVALHVKGVDGPVAHIVSTWAVPALPDGGPSA